MRVEQIMTANPASCGPDASLQEVAKVMVDRDCGLVPIIEGDRLVGTITDRDITCRMVALGKNPLEFKARDCMTSPVISVEQGADVDEALELMADNKIRRLVVVDEDGRCAGIVAQADIVERVDEEEAAQLVSEISQPGASPSHVH